ncbi:MAG: YhbY family RNA-binding protein [Oscillospiraceae bacterium]|nr:YhbY family RNA-binding protein [Oscillospiraceae bacterium]
MNITNSKQRAKLKSLAQKLDTIIQVGKNGVTDETIKVVSDAFNTKELIKIKKIETSPVDEKEIARILAEKTNSEIVQIIGSKIVLYKKNQDKKNNKKIIKQEKSR